MSKGQFYEPERVFSQFGLSENAHLSHPLGMAPYDSQGTIPTYPFGYPVLMLPLIWLFGLPGAFWTTPLLAAGTVVLTYCLARHLIGRTAGVLAAALVFVFPNFLHGSFAAMSDVPATCFVALSLVALLVIPAGAGTDLLLGAALGLGLWIRPNMVLLLVPVLGWLGFQCQWRRLFRVSFTLASFVLIAGLVNWSMYGLPWKTGYGSPSFDTAFRPVTERGLRHLVRLNTQQAGVGLILLSLSLFVSSLGLSPK